MPSINYPQSALTSIKFIIAAVIIYTLIQIFQWQDGYWAMISLAAVIRPNTQHIYIKAIMRIIGTIIGGILAYILLVIAQDNLYVVTIGLFFISLFAGLIILQKNSFNYAGIIIGLSAIIIVASAQGAGNYLDVVISRASFVLLGIIVLFIVNLLIKPFDKNAQTTHLTNDILTSIKTLYNKPKIQTNLISAILLALSVTITFFPWLVLQYAGGFWAAVTCYFIIEETAFGVYKKAKLRLFAHIGAAVIALLAVLLTQYIPLLSIIILLIGYIICALIIVNANALSHTGNTMAIAMTIMILAGLNEVDIHIIIARFLNVVLGIIIGLIICHMFKLGNSKAD
ncbi:FUSC family protein [Thiotrichales bacterium 19S3-7]|nr:FUSC family protein [Thiotrichales bacterium 19S3-7]MCF6801030.1 FUSC family protein [Thiotrichales bacterium 19S3-11]